MSIPENPDIRGAIVALDKAMIALAVAKSALLAETGEPVPLASLRDREHFDPLADGYRLGAVEVTYCTDQSEDGFLCTLTGGHGGDHAQHWPGDHATWAHGGVASS